VAIKAMAAKLARLVYRMLRYGMQFVDKGAGVLRTEASATANLLSEAQGG
jgi:hypothetical protein